VKDNENAIIMSRYLRTIFLYPPEFRPKQTLSKSKEKISDEAEEKLLDKEAEAKIVTRVDMADAKYVVGDHRNGDAKIELDANKRVSQMHVYSQFVEGYNCTDNKDSLALMIKYCQSNVYSEVPKVENQT
jgi:hypothetical protein